MSPRSIAESDDVSMKQRLSCAKELLSEGKFCDAEVAFHDILKHSYNNYHAETGLKCCKYWNSRISVLENKDTSSYYETGRALYQEWKNFTLFLETQKNVEEEIVNCMMMFIFGFALEYLKKAEQENNIAVVPLFSLMGFFYKKLGYIDKAIYYFQKIICSDHFNADAYAQLGNCYELQGDVRAAKLLLREAFFLNPGVIDLVKLDSKLLFEILKMMKQYQLSRECFVYWIPVYGRIYNILDVSRELQQEECEKLQKEIQSMKRNIDIYMEQENQCEVEKLKAQLINRYLWLYDFFLRKKNCMEDLKKVETRVQEQSLTVYNILKNSIK